MDDPYKQKSIATRLDKLIKDNGTTIAEVARDTGIPKSTLHSWTAGAAPKDFDAAKRLAEALGVSLSYLLTGQCEREAGATRPSSLEIVGHGFHGIAEIKIERVIKKIIKGE